MATKYDAKRWPISGTAMRIPVSFRDSSNGLVTGWAVGTMTLYLDNVLQGTVTAIEAPASSGIGYADIPAAYTAGSMLQVKGSASGAVASYDVYYLLNMAQFTGRWDAQNHLLFEQFLHDIFIQTGGNGSNMTGSQLQYLNEDGSTHTTSTVVQSSYTGSASKPA